MTPEELNQAATDGIMKKVLNAATEALGTPDRSNEPVVGNLKDYQDLAKSMNQLVCPQCGYCPCCGRPRGNWNNPIYPTTPYPYWWN